MVRLICRIQQHQGAASALKWPVLFQRLHGTQELILRATDVAKLPAKKTMGFLLVLGTEHGVFTCFYCVVSFEPPNFFGNFARGNDDWPLNFDALFSDTSVYVNLGALGNLEKSAGWWTHQTKKCAYISRKKRVFRCHHSGSKRLVSPAPPKKWTSPLWQAEMVCWEPQLLWIATKHRDTWQHGNGKSHSLMD